jgi:hypothetical protein
LTVFVPAFDVSDDALQGGLELGRHLGHGSAFLEHSSWLCSEIISLIQYGYINLEKD